MLGCVANAVEKRLHSTNEMPVLMDADEIAYLQKHLRKRQWEKMVEWGSGGSTLMFMDLMQDHQHLISIEDKHDWYDSVGTAIADRNKTDQVTHVFAPNQLKPWFAVPEEETPATLEFYISPLQNMWDADIYFVDGIARGACLATILHKAQNRDASVFLHDYRGREAWYAWAVNLFGETEQVGSTLLRLKM